MTLKIREAARQKVLLSFDVWVECYEGRNAPARPKHAQAWQEAISGTPSPSFAFTAVDASWTHPIMVHPFIGFPSNLLTQELNKFNIPDCGASTAASVGKRQQNSQNKQNLKKCRSS